MSQIRVFVVDDSVVYRTLIQKTLNSIPGVRAVGVAENGKEALENIPIVKPDLITLDINMPVMDGLESMRKLHDLYPQLRVIMVSAITSEGAAATLQALHAGALDFITKPDTGDEVRNTALLREQLSTLITKYTNSELHSSVASQTGTIKRNNTELVSVPCCKHLSCLVKPEVVAIGISTGGPKALGELLLSLPADYPLPVLIVQHMPRLFTKSLAESFHQKVDVNVVEAQNGEVLKAGTAYIAPGGLQMKIRGGNGRDVVVQITDEPAENHCKPSADYLFRSVAQVYGNRAIGVIMTGMGSDGVLGLKLMKRQGASVIAQDRMSSTVWGMPGMAVEAGVVDIILPLQDIATELIRCV